MGNDTLVDDRPFIRLGTRASPLARWQANWVAAQLERFDVRVQIEPIQTSGDNQSTVIGGQSETGVFTKEIQRALLDDRIDLAVHSLKDMPTEAVGGLSLAAVPARAAEGDALVSSGRESLIELPEGARVATGSLRRAAQLKHARPDLQIVGIRGNVETRLRKLADGDFEGLVLAEAGLRRLGLADRIVEVLDKQVMLPAVGQGALALEIRTDDGVTLRHVSRLNHDETWQAVMAERALLRHLRGGCLAPIGAWGRYRDGRLWMDAVVLSADGRKRLYASSSVGASPEELGIELAQCLLDQGASELIALSRHDSPN